MRGILEDIRAVRARDPAARSTLEVLLLYPGMHAVWAYRITHWLWRHGARFPARVLAHLARRWTGVEIHPGARLGRRVTIDHGMGVVIGETAEIGDDVHLYSGVVLGGVAARAGKRHPTVESGVVLGAGAVVLGPVQVGKGARIGAGAVVREDVPPGAVVLAPKPWVVLKPDLNGNLPLAELPFSGFGI